MSRNSKHTPGPWALCRAEQSGIAVAHAEDGEFKQPRAALAIVGSHPASDCNFHYIVAMNSHVQAQADARLIAAAPDMLSALQKFEVWSKAENNHEGTTFMERVQMLMDLDACVRAAIAKATGEQQ